jgi:Protein of unknwon function (DUF3310)
MSANDRQEGGNHYRDGIQHWDAIKDWMTPDQYRGYLLGSASKYLARYNKKDGVEGAKKSIHYLEKLAEFEKEMAPKQFVAPVAPEEIAPIKPKKPEILAPRSDDYYTYEGGTKALDMYRCRQCRVHFEIPLGAEPREYHAHDNGEEAGYAYANQDRVKL